MFSLRTAVEERGALLSQLCFGSIPLATVLIGKLELIIFKEVVHEDDKLAHAGS
jgi:hypothetical protein